MKQVSMIRKYHSQIPQSHTADQPTAARGGAKVHLQSQVIRKTIKVKQPALSFPSKVNEYDHTLQTSPWHREEEL